MGVIFYSQLAGILYTKILPESDGGEKSPTATFKNPLTRYNFNTFLKIRSRVQFYLFQAFSCIGSMFLESHMPPSHPG
jgi:hypothetical protein